MKRVIYISLAAVLLLTALVSGKLGYETMQSGEYSQEMQVFTTQAQTDGTKPLVEFNITKSKEMVLYPLVADGAREKSGFAEYILTAKNTGENAEYIRFYVAVPKMLDDDGILHMDYNTDTSLYTKTKLEKTTMIKGMEYNVYALTYIKSLPAKAEQDTDYPQTPAAVYGFYLDEKVNVKGHKIYKDGKYTEFKNDEVRVYSVVHAYQLESESGIDDIPVTVPTFYDEEGKEIK